MRLGLREIIFLVVLLVVPVASYFYVFKPRNYEIYQAEREVEIKQAKLDKLREVADKIDDIGLAIEKGRAAIELVEAKLPSQQDVEVSRYMAELNAHPLLKDVSLQYSEERKFEGERMRQFEIRMKLNSELDVRDVAPLIKRNRLSDPMGDNLEITAPGRSTASALPREGR